jgi:hypothetical protein
MLFSQLFNAKQIPGQSVFDYANHVIEKLNSLQILDESFRLQHFMNGLLPKYKHELLKTQPKSLQEAQNFCAILETNGIVDNDDMAALKAMMTEVKQAIKDQASTVPVDVMTPYYEVAAVMPNTNYTGSPPQAYQAANQPFQQPFGPRPRSQQPRAPFPVSQYGAPVRPGYTSQPMFEPRFDQGYAPRRMYQPRPYQGNRPRFDPATQANTNANPPAIQGSAPTDGAPMPGYKGARFPGQNNYQQRPYHPVF